MGIKEATIYLDNQWNTYYAGQTVNGRIEYEFDSPKKVRGVYVKFKGEAHTSWHEKETRRDADGKTHDVDTAHTGDEEYFQITYYILGSKTGGEIEIPPGRHVYTFTCTLPPTLPSSFEGEFGYVRYTVKVVLDRPMKFDQETKMAFTVINPLDLNLNPHYREPIHMQFEKTFCCLCCASAPLSVDVRAPISGYCPGQYIPIEIDVDNKSNVQLHLVKIYLRKVVTYRATMPTSSTKKTKHVIVETQEGPSPANTTKHWSLKLEIPPLPPSNLVNCGIIDLDYDLKVECVVSGVHLNMSDKKYITIGTVPLVDGGVPPAAINGQPNVTPPGGPGQPVAQPTLPVQPPQPTLPVQPPQPYLPSPTPAIPTVPAGGEGAGGWVMPAPTPAPAPVPYSSPYPAGPGPAPPAQPLPQSLYPTLDDPVFKESIDTARTIQDRNDSQYVRIVGPSNFAPRYPTYAAVQPPPLPR